MLNSDAEVPLDDNDLTLRNHAVVYNNVNGLNHGPAEFHDRAGGQLEYIFQGQLGMPERDTHGKLNIQQKVERPGI